jgi:hypothetical protein
LDIFTRFGILVIKEESVLEAPFIHTFPRLEIKLAKKKRAPKKVNQKLLIKTPMPW